MFFDDYDETLVHKHTQTCRHPFPIYIYIYIDIHMESRHIKPYNVEKVCTIEVNGSGKRAGG